MKVMQKLIKNLADRYRLKYDKNKNNVTVKLKDGMIKELNKPSICKIFDYKIDKGEIYMKNFYFEDGCFYCNKDDSNTLHETHIEVRTLTSYDVEYGRIQKPSIINRLNDNYLYLVCSCGEVEDISGEFMIKEDNYIVKK